MGWTGQRPAIERAAEAVAAACLGGAAAFALLQLVPLAGTALLAASAIGGLAAAGAGWVVLSRMSGEQAEAVPTFEPADFADDEVELAASDAEDELLLDDPIPALDPDSRVVRLFEPDQPDVLPEPGELVARIADFLGSGRPARPMPEPVRADASAALHAALADIRRSLR